MLRARPFRGQTGYAIDLVGYDARFDALGVPVQAEDLLDVRPVQVVIQVSAGPQTALLNAAMPFFHRGRQARGRQARGRQARGRQARGRQARF